VKQILCVIPQIFCLRSLAGFQMGKASDMFVVVLKGFLCNFVRGRSCLERSVEGQLIFVFCTSRHKVHDTARELSRSITCGPIEQ
jgi:hypothetical protein